MSVNPSSSPLPHFLPALSKGMELPAMPQEPLGFLYRLAKSYSITDCSFQLSEPISSPLLRMEVTGRHEDREDFIELAQRASLLLGVPATLSIVATDRFTKENPILFSCPRVCISAPAHYLSPDCEGRIVTHETATITSFLLRTHLPAVDPHRIQQLLKSQGLDKISRIEDNGGNITTVVLNAHPGFLGTAQCVELLRSVAELQEKQSSVIVVKFNQTNQMILDTVADILGRNQPSNISIDAPSCEIGLELSTQLPPEISNEISRNTGYTVRAEPESSTIQRYRSRAFIAVNPDACSLSPASEFEAAHLKAILTQYFGACEVTRENLFLLASVPKLRVPQSLIKQIQHEVQDLQIPLLIQDNAALSTPMTQSNFEHVLYRSIPPEVLIRGIHYGEEEIEIVVSANRHTHQKLSRFKDELEACVRSTVGKPPLPASRFTSIRIVLAPFEKKVSDTLLDLDHELQRRLALEVDSRGRIIARRLLSSSQGEHFDLTSLAQQVHNLWKSITDSEYHLDRYMHLSPQATSRALGQIEDWTDRPVLSIDAPGATLFEDGFHCTPLPNQAGWRVEAHIARVAPFIPLGSDLDRIARNNFRAIYGNGVSIPMLPKAFLLRYASFIPGRPRYAWSVTYNISQDGTVSDISVHQTKIRLNSQFSWSEADRIIESRATTSTTDEALSALHLASEAALKKLPPPPDNIIVGPARRAVDTQLLIVSRYFQHCFREANAQFISGRVGGAARDYRRLLNQHALEGLYGYERPLPASFLNSIKHLERTYLGSVECRTRQADTLMNLRNKLSSLSRDGMLWGTFDIDESGSPIIRPHEKEENSPEVFAWIHDDALRHEINAVVTPEGQRVEKGAPIVTKVCGFDLIDGRLVAELLLDYS